MIKLLFCDPIARSQNRSADYNGVQSLQIESYWRECQFQRLEAIYFYI